MLPFFRESDVGKLFRIIVNGFQVSDMDMLTHLIVVSIAAAFVVGATAIHPLFGLFLGLILFLG